MASSFSNIDTSLLGYKDLDLRFKTHPLFGDIRPVTDVDAIKNSIRNILLTRRGEKPFEPRFGSNVLDYLFENATDATKYSMGEEIRYSIEEHESRVKLQSIFIEDDIDNNAFFIRLDLIIISSGQQVELPIVLKRLR